MKCKQCDTEMLIDSTTIDEEKGTETFNNKCPNPKCPNFGYKKEGETSVKS